MFCRTESLFGMEEVQETKVNPTTSVIRVKPALVYTCLSLQDRPVMVRQHYYRKRTVPCLKFRCPGCRVSPPRSYAYLYVKFEAAGRLSLPRVLEMTFDALASLVEQAVKLEGGTCESLHGLVFVIQRLKPEKKSKLDVQALEYRTCQEKVNGMIIQQALCRMWDLPVIEDATDQEAWEEKVREIVNSDGHYLR